MTQSQELGARGLEAGPFLRDLWYFVCLAKDIRPRGLKRFILLGEPVVVARGEDGRVFALRDICPHRAAPLSAGRVVGETVECPYHGWRFGAEGGCRLIPSLVGHEGVATDRIRVRAFPTVEQDGLIWIYAAADERIGTPDTAPPRMPRFADATPALRESVTLECGMDDAVVGLMDPTHGPFVHASWLWRKQASIHEKAKAFAPSDLGFTMVRHKPSANSAAYKILGREMTTEITFRLPGLRFEEISLGENRLLGLTAVTPIDAHRTELTQIFFWTLPWLGLVKQGLRPFVRRFLRQDGHILKLLASNTAFEPRMMLIEDADVQAKWYYRLKREWADSRRDGRPFENPLTARTLRWRS